MEKIAFSMLDRARSGMQTVHRDSHVRKDLRCLIDAQVDRARSTGIGSTVEDGRPDIESAAKLRRRNYRSHQDPPRTRAVSFKLTAAEYAMLSAAAERERLAVGAYAAQASLAAARGTARPEYAALRQLLGAVMQASEQVRRIGINFNQAVTALNSTGEFTQQLPKYAAAAARTVDKLDEVADEVRRRLP
jgi:hypothetical protein